MIAVLVAVIVAVSLGLLSIELAGWTSVAARFIARIASQQLPLDDRARWNEEWQADLAELGERPLWMFLHALQIAMAAVRLRRELDAPVEEYTEIRTRVLSSDELTELVFMLGTGLSPLEADALRLFLEGFSYEDMAGRLGCDTKMIDKALQRVKRKILEANS